MAEAGSAFWREAQSILDRVRAAALLVEDKARGLSGHLAIGLTETALFAPPVAKVVKHACEQWPGIELSLLQARSNHLVVALIERRIDVAFVHSPAPDIATVQCRPFLTEELFVAAPNTHPLAARRSIDFSALVDEPLILPHGRSGDEAMEMRARIAAAFAVLGHAQRVVQETPGCIMAVNLVAAGLELSRVPAGMTGLHRDTVAYKPLRSTPPLLTDIILMSRASDPSPITANFLALAAEASPLGCRLPPARIH